MAEIAQQNDVYQVRVVGHIEGQETNNVWYFRCASGAGDADVELHLILVIASCFITHIIPVLANGWALQDLRWKKVYPVLGNENITVPSGTLVGAVSTDALPSFCSVVTSLRTAVGGKSHRGRFYLAGVPESATDGSVLDTGNAFWTGFVAFLACLATNFIPGDPPGSNSWAQMIYSRKLGGTHFPYPLAAFTQVLSYKPVQQLGTTRSRKVGRGS